MGLALALGERHLGRTAPNPSVGCVIVKDGLVVGRGWTQPGGRPHAEAEALARAGDAARGATAYVTLEPCSNWGKTPPCTKGLIEAGISRVVIGCVDPDPRVDGKGIAWLREAGLEVTTGVMEADALAQNLGLYRRIRDGRPMVGLKLAMSLDGRIATRTGDSQWITGEAARRFGHRLRAAHDAIMVGSGTALADDRMRKRPIDDRHFGQVLLGVFYGLFGINKPPAYQSSALAHSVTGSSSPSKMALRMPGMDNKCSVSEMAFQSSSHTSTALLLFPVITIGLCVSAASSIRLYSLALASVALSMVMALSSCLAAYAIGYVNSSWIFRNGGASHFAGVFSFLRSSVGTPAVEGKPCICSHGGPWELGNVRNYGVCLEKTFYLSRRVSLVGGVSFLGFFASLFFRC